MFETKKLHDMVASRHFVNNSDENVMQSNDSHVWNLTFVCLQFLGVHLEWKTYIIRAKLLCANKKTLMKS